MSAAFPTSRYRDFTIRPVAAPDVPAIHALISAIFADYDFVFDPIGEDRHLARPHEYFARAGGIYWVATSGGQVVGTVGAIPYPTDDEAAGDPTTGAEAGCYAPRETGDNPDMIVGAAPTERIGQLRSMYVDRSARGVGLGTHLAQMCIDWLRRNGCTTVVLWTDTKFADAHRLYERLGFRRVVVRHVVQTNGYSEYKYELRV